MSVPARRLPSISLRPPSEVSCTGKPAAQRLRLLSYNIQAGIAANSYRHYLTHSWKHVLPCSKRLDNLSRIATLIGGFDIVGLQEVDGGSLRSGVFHQTEYLAIAGRVPYWEGENNRKP